MGVICRSGAKDRREGDVNIRFNSELIGMVAGLNQDANGEAHFKFVLMGMKHTVYPAT